MWVFLPDAFVSVVADWNSKEHLYIRARFRGDLERLPWPSKSPKVQETPDRDYRYRVRVTRQAWADLLVRVAMNMDWTNVKNAIPNTPEHFRRYKGMSSVWGVMMNAAEQQHIDDAERLTTTMRQAKLPGVAPKTDKSGAKRSAKRSASA